MTGSTRHLLYIDESGGHDLTHVDPNWPIFVLVGLLVGETYYARTLVPRVKEFKLRHGLGKETPLHSRDIRRHDGPFQFLADPQRREVFYEGLNQLFASSRIRLFAVIVRKALLSRAYMFPPNPYYVSLGQILSSVCGPPGTPTRWRPRVARIVAERRGKLQDRQLQAEYQRHRQHGLPSYGAPMWSTAGRRRSSACSQRGSISLPRRRPSPAWSWPTWPPIHWVGPM